MRTNWANDYVGLPYATGGRTRDGLDCWGLVRLVYAEQLGVDLPSFAGEYQTPHDARVRELMATRREGWASTDLAQPGDVVLFRVWGGVQHVGVITDAGRFLHIRIGRTATVERLGGIWSNRVEGFYRYAPQPEPVTVAGLPHPLRTVRLDGQVPAGMSLAQIQDWILAQTATPGEVTRQAIIMVDGFAVPAEQWGDLRPLPGQRVEYRAVAQGDTFRSVLNIGVLVGAMLLAPVIAPYFSFLGLSTALTTGLATAAVAAAGTLLVNYLFPVRPPDQKGAETPTKANLLYGGQNQANPYGAIPVVLGRVRFTPPLAAENYVETEGSTSYLRTALCWGYGPLQITDLRMGDLDLNSLDECEYTTIEGETGDDTEAFDRLYGTDTTQDVVNVQLVAPYWASSSWTRAATTGLTTVTGTTDHGFQVGWAYWFPQEDRVYEITATPTSKSLQFVSRVKTAGSGGSLAGCAGPFTSQVISGECSKITATIHFPDGLRRIKSGGSSKVGDFDAYKFTAVVQVRQLDSGSLVPLADWGDISERTDAKKFMLQRAFFNVDSDAVLETVFQWHSVTVDERGNVRVRTGALTQGLNQEPSGNLLIRLQNTQTGLESSFTRLPAIPDNEIELHRICVRGGSVFTTQDLRSSAGFTVTGCGLTITGLRATVAAGTFVRAANHAVNIGLTGQYYKADEPFTLNISFEVPLGRWEVRVARTYYSDADLNNYRNFADAFLVAFTGYAPGRPVTPPKPLAMTAIRVRASNQISGTVEGFSGIVTSVCKTWSAAQGAWVEQPTRNPAALFRYVLQHPGNAQAVPDSGIDLVALQGWSEYCSASGFMFDMVVLEPRSILDMLRDIAAAGRASPALRDGKWTVIVDAPQSTFAQFFTPANSRDFEGARALPKIPHAFRVQFINSERAFQPDELLVYADGYSAANATLIEGLQLPGVTTPNAVYKHARFHLAQLKLRPETYSLTVDIEHLICQRGDLVKVTHDVPMWGLQAGRIKDWVNSTTLLLDQPVPMNAGTQYTIRIRLDDGTSITRTVAAVGSTGAYSTVTLTTTINSTQGAAGNLFMFGQLNSETVNCLVLAIEPQENMEARLTLVDYAPAIYNSDTETVPAFNSQITLPQLLLRDVVKRKPALGTIRSDEATMVLLSNGQYGYRIKVSYTNPRKLPKNIKFVEGEIIETASAAGGGGRWRGDGRQPVGASYFFSNVREGVAYKMRLRYVTNDGRVGGWQSTSSHTVVGRALPPAQVANFAAVADGRKIKLTWDPNTEVDVVAYEIRTTNSGFGNPGFVARISGTEVRVDPPTAGSGVTLYIRALDSAENYSATSASVSVTYDRAGVPPAPTLKVNKVNTNSVTLEAKWEDAAAGTFEVAGYEIRSADSGWGTGGELYKGRAKQAVLTGVAADTPTTFYKRAYDVRGTYGNGPQTFTHAVGNPADMDGATLIVTRVKTDLVLRLSGSVPAKPSDFACYEWRIGQVRAGATSGDDTPDAIVAGTTDNFWNDPDCEVFTSDTRKITVALRNFPTPRISAAGVVYRAACRMRDKSGNYSTASALGTVTVAHIT